MNVITETQKATKINGKYETLITLYNVLIKVPDFENLIYVPEHALEIGGATAIIKEHYRYTNVFRDIKIAPTKENPKPKVYVPRNFYLSVNFTGETIVAEKVEIVKKTNHLERENLIINIFKNDSKKMAKPDCRLKIGVPTGDYEIPNAGLFIKVETEWK